MTSNHQNWTHSSETPTRPQLNQHLWCVPSTRSKRFGSYRAGPISPMPSDSFIKPVWTLTRLPRGERKDHLWRCSRLLRGLSKSHPRRVGEARGVGWQIPFSAASSLSSGSPITALAQMPEHDPCTRWILRSLKSCRRLTRWCATMAVKSKPISFSRVRALVEWCSCMPRSTIT